MPELYKDPSAPGATASRDASNPGASVVVMGVSGCGKSTLAQALGQALGLPVIEGDDFHASESVAKMRAGMALTDADRAGWLERLGRELGAHPRGAVLSCSALKRDYRERLRAAAPGLRFVFMALPPAEAQRRVAERAGRHMFPASLVADQFATLEPPTAEPGVLTVDATAATSALACQAAGWLRAQAGGTGTPG